MTLPQEVPLSAGNMTRVVRVGNTVRRTTGPWTPTIHAFMRHLRASGFLLGPTPLGIDERGREILTLLPGTPATYPLPAFAWTDATLVAVAQILRRFHDASLGFAAPADGRWQSVAFIERQAARGDPAQQAVLARGDAAIYQRDIAYLARLRRARPRFA